MLFAPCRSCAFGAHDLCQPMRNRVIYQFQPLKVQKVYLLQQSQSLGESHPVPAQALPAYKNCKKAEPQRCLTLTTRDGRWSTINSVCIGWLKSRALNAYEFTGASQLKSTVLSLIIYDWVGTIHRSLSCVYPCKHMCMSYSVHVHNTWTIKAKKPKAFQFLKEAVLEKGVSWKSSDFSVKPISMSI